MGFVAGFAVAMDLPDPRIVEYRGIEFAASSACVSNQRNGVILRVTVAIRSSSD
jgi:hypothetical protein